MPRLYFLLLLAAGACTVPIACSRATSTTTGDRGELMIELATDLVPPKDIDQLDVAVTHHGAMQFEKTFMLGPSATHLPQTFSVAAAVGDADPVTVVVTASRKGVPRIRRTANLIVPENRAALLRMPMQWFCDGSAPGAIVPKGAPFPCASGQTCVAGRCASADVDVTTLPDFHVDNVLGTRCFDTLGCFPTGSRRPATIAPGCLVPGSGLTANDLLVELPAGSDGVCDAAHCLISLESDPVFGFFPSGMSVQGVSGTALPSAVCDRLSAANGALSIFEATCAPRAPNTPACGPWSSIGPDSGVAAPSEDIATLPSPPRCLALDATNVYFATSDTLFSAPKTGGPPTPLSPGHTAIGTCASDGTKVYFNDGPTLFAVTAAGGAATIVGALGGSIVHLALSNASVLAIVADASPSVLYAFPKSGGPPTSVFSADSNSDAGVPQLLGIAVEEPGVYLMQDIITGSKSATAYRVPLAGGAATLIGFVPGGTLNSLAYDANYLYASIDGVGALDGNIGRVPKSGQGPPVIFIPGQANPPPGYERGVVVSGNALFWTAGDAVRTVSGSSVMAIVVQATSPIAFIALDDTHVYSATIDPGARITKTKRP